MIFGRTSMLGIIALCWAMVPVWMPPPAAAADSKQLAGTTYMEAEGDLAAQMVAGIDRYLLRATDESIHHRSERWKRDLSSHEQYAQSIEANRRRFRKLIGAHNPRHGFGQATGFRREQLVGAEDEHAEGIVCRVERVRWPVHYTGGGWSTEGEGLLITPLGVEVRADVVAIPDADTTPASFVPVADPGTDAGVPLRLARSGCRVLVPMLINRSDQFSLVEGQRRTNQPHREFLYRQAYELGKHVIGYEVEKVQSAFDCFEEEAQQSGSQRPLGVFGYGEGGLIAFYAAAIDPRIDAACVSGYFASRQDLWREPIYRNVWSLLTEFGDAEIATLIAPRPLVIEAAQLPEVTGPPVARDGVKGAAPGRLTTPGLENIASEAARAMALVAGLNPPAAISLIASDDGHGPPGSDATLRKFLTHLSPRLELAPQIDWVLGAAEPSETAQQFRQFQQLVEYTQHLLRDSEDRREAFWSKADRSSLAAWQESTAWYRDYFGREVIGRIDEPRLPLSARSRQIYDEPAYRGYEVMLDVLPDVFAYGILLVPKQRIDQPLPVVVCQHGLEGRPTDVADPAQDHPAYHRFACRLAEKGYVTFAPQNPYIGGDAFRTLQRKANPLGLSLFSFIVAQHEAILDWLSEQPFVDSQRIAFYGLSYGGKTAMRVPALIDRYCLSICSADFNEWIWKNVSTRSRYSYLGTNEYEMVEFDLGSTFNYSEMAALIAPRPFMVERGHHDGVAPDHWVAYEYAKVRKLFADLGLPERTRIEFFNGPHTIHGVGTFEFLDQHLHFRRTDESGDKKTRFDLPNEK